MFRDTFKTDPILFFSIFSYHYLQCAISSCYKWGCVSISRKTSVKEVLVCSLVRGPCSSEQKKSFGAMCKIVNHEQHPVLKMCEMGCEEIKMGMWKSDVFFTEHYRILRIYWALLIAGTSLFCFFKSPSGSKKAPNNKTKWVCFAGTE